MGTFARRPMPFGVGSRMRREFRPINPPPTSERIRRVMKAMDRVNAALNAPVKMEKAVQVTLIISALALCIALIAIGMAAR